jgi:hypothetical protein
MYLIIRIKEIKTQTVTKAIKTMISPAMIFIVRESD